MKKIILVGKPNSGKSLLFNQLTGLRQKVANFPGVTVSLTSGQFDGFTVVDYPGTYSLIPMSEDEKIAVEQLHVAVQSDDTSLILCNLDATKLNRSLVFALQVQALARNHGKGCVFALNMVDEAQRLGHQFDTDAMSLALGSPVFAISAKTLIGIDVFIPQLKALASAPDKAKVQSTWVHQLPPLDAAKTLAKEHGLEQGVVLAGQTKIDRWLLHTVWGALAFLSVMFLLFQSIFSWAAPIMDLLEQTITWTGSQVAAVMPLSMLSDFTRDALFGGLGGFLVFVPQIMVLTFIIGLLEDSGYLARAALICHKPLSLFGLSGRSFIPYLSGYACAIPGILAARTIESPRRRLITMLTVPMMSCSARLPVFALLIAVLIPQQSYLGGLVNLQGCVFFLLYFGGLVMGLMLSKIIDGLLQSNDATTDIPFILELPSYRLPHWRPLIYRTVNSAIQFVKRAGPIIFFVTVAIWILGYFPNNGDLTSSWLAQIGHWISPLFEPMGLDWRYTLAILLSFLAREVFVGVLGTLFSMDNAEDNLDGLAAQIQADGLGFASGIALLVFYVIALQCVATVATLKSETGKNRYSWGAFVAYGILAYAVSYLVYALLSL